jgi:hypothetical protein
MSSPLAPALELETFYCAIDDVSASGLSFDVHTRVPTGATLELHVKLSQPAEEFRYAGVVVRSVEGWHDLVLSYCIGVELVGGLADGKWCQAVERRQAHD